LLVVPRKTRLSNAQGWEAARTLRQAREVLDAEPLFRTSGLEASPEILAPHERKPAAKSGSGGKPLPCAQTNCIWQLREINATEAWLLKPPPGGQQQGKGIVIGHPDTGYTKHFEIWPGDGTSPRLKPALGYNFEEGRPDPVDLMTGNFPGHGTATASVIMSSPGGDGAMFVTGAAPEADIVPFRVKDSVIHVSFKNLIQAIYRAVDCAGVHVISMSLGGPVKSKALESALGYAISQGVIVIAAAGNRYPWTVYPAGYRSVIAMAATNCEHKPWSGSTHGEQVDLSAPGESVWRAHSNQKGKTLAFDVAPSSGSSYATALAAGAAATWLAFWGRDFLIARFGAGQLQETFASLLKTRGRTVPPAWDSKNYGAGILEMRKLLEAPLPPASKARKVSAGPLGKPDIAHYFPEVKAARVQSEIARVTGIAPGPKAKQGAAGVDLEELAFQVATNPALRNALYKRMSGPAAKSTPGQSERAKVAALLNDASATLHARLLAN
jgi:thermitase